MWQAKSARDGRVKRGAHSSRKDDHTRVSAQRTLHPQQNVLSSAARELFPPHASSENANRTLAEQAKNPAKSRAITCFKCGMSGHVASACNSDARPPMQMLRLRWHWAHCARLPYFCFAVSRQREFLHFRHSRFYMQERWSAVCRCWIGEVRIPDALVDTGSALLMLSSAIYARLPSAPAIQFFTRAAPDIIGLGGASAKIRGYVDAPVEVAGVAVHHLVLVVEGLAFPLIIGTDILRAHGAVLTLDESAPVRLKVRECAVCREQRRKLPAESPTAARAARLAPILRVVSRLSPSAPRPAAQARAQMEKHAASSPIPLAGAHTAEPRLHTPAARSTKATRAPLLVSVRVSVPPSPSQAHARPRFARPSLLISALRRPLPLYS